MSVVMIVRMRVAVIVRMRVAVIMVVGMRVACIQPQHLFTEGAKLAVHGIGIAAFNSLKSAFRQYLNDMRLIAQRRCNRYGRARSL